MKRRLDLETLGSWLATLLMLGLAAPSFADPDPAGGQREGRRRGPPQVALDACSDSSEGDACRFTGRRDKSRSGLCESRQQRLVCVPEGHADHRRGRAEEAPDA